LILVGERAESALVLVEGHCRATAYVRAATHLPVEVDAIVGFSPDMGAWKWY
jgi:hypothetical protein